MLRARSIELRNSSRKTASLCFTVEEKRRKLIASETKQQIGEKTTFYSLTQALHINFSAFDQHIRIHVVGENKQQTNNV